MGWPALLAFGAPNPDPQNLNREAANEVARIIYSVHDDVKDKEFELELSWICEESGNRHQLMPKVGHAAPRTELAVGVPLPISL